VNNKAAQNGIIAIVDDDGPLCEALESVLKAAGFAVCSFGSAEAFLDSPVRPEIVCLILDVRLPGMSGIELKRRLSETGDTVPVIFVTAHGDASVRAVVMKGGAKAFLNKPFRSDELLHATRAALAGVSAAKNQ
jgi:FixJ family two-component response regulator